jgi:hypothetical protein
MRGAAMRLDGGRLHLLASYGDAKLAPLQS